MKIKPFPFLSLLSILFTMTACEPVPGTGTFVITLYNQYCAENPEYLEEEDTELYSIVQIEGLTPEYYIGDKKGVITVYGVPEGTYTVHPLFLSTDYDKEMTAVADQTTAETIIIPDLTLEFYMVNPAELTDVNFRTGLARGINRETLLANVADISGEMALYTLLPSDMCHDGLETTAAVTESTSVLSGSSGVTFALTYNFSNLRQAIASEIETQWEVYGDVGQVDLVSLSYDPWLEAVNTQDFDVIRMGWGLDSNNPIAFLKYIFDSTGYTSETYTTIIGALEQAQTNALAGTEYISLEDFLDYTDELHTLILDEGLAIPLYE